MVGSGFLLDDLAHALAGSGAVGQADAALFSGYLGKLFDDIEEGFFVLAAEQPGVMDRGDDDLIEGIDFVPGVDLRMGYNLWLLLWPRRGCGEGEGGDGGQNGASE